MNKQEIENFLINFGIIGYTINPDVTVDVDQSVYLSNQVIEEIPIQFGTVDGNFHCFFTNLNSLKGTPRKVSGVFDVSNNRLTNLIGGPEIVNEQYNCSDNQLVSLEGAPKQTNYFKCSNNNLKNLKYSPEIVTSGFDCSGNPLESLEGSPLKTSIFICSKTKIKNLIGIGDVDKKIYITYNPITSIEGIKKFKELLITSDEARIPELLEFYQTTTKTPFSVTVTYEQVQKALLKQRIKDKIQNQSENNNNESVKQSKI